jgi:hypothetical protein
MTHPGGPAPESQTPQPWPPQQQVPPPWSAQQARPQVPVAPQPGWGTAESSALNEAQAALRKARTALGWAIGATVGAFLAMLLAVGALVADGSSLDDYTYEPLRGEIAALPDGAPLGSDRLEHVLVDLLREVGAEDLEVSCPDTASVTVSTAVVCTGDVEGSTWTGIVFFEDTKGTFVVVEV